MLICVRLFLKGIDRLIAIRISLELVNSVFKVLVSLSFVIQRFIIEMFELDAFVKSSETSNIICQYQRPKVSHDEADSIILFNSELF